MASLEYWKGLHSHIDTINRCKTTRVLVVYAGKDMLIETKISRELASSFIDHHELNCKDNGEVSEKKVSRETSEFFSNGVKTVSINFEKSGHFLQRDRARYIADSIEAILRSRL
ncbi:hypothetical protein TELCIR_09804 [Teladorsagia circumcincta]|uniref:Serine hydrolase FSH domain-containing protein n=1 Tax=Teladorsagia circumcincta TaxID=45464 RepID=A0A2G9UG07_TELCI|nr:hypothetical protein TELCIR_09804 [Teladorsagia circumcincta]